MVLSLLYPNLKYGQVKFHQDHIHPYCLFTDAKLNKYNIGDDNWERWKDKRDKLANLQIMEGGNENISKNKRPFKDWLYSKDESGQPTISDIKKYKQDNYIPLNVSENFSRFENFYKENTR